MINGIDVSHHNDKLDWKKIQELNLTQNLYFTFIKVSEGLGNPDGKFDANRTGSAGAGLLSGGYHFFLPAEDATKQADIFSDRIGSLQPGELPPVVDIESTVIMKKKKIVRGEQWTKIGPAKRIAVIKTFLNRVENRLGAKPIIYTLFSFWKDIITASNSASNMADFIDHPLWLVNLKGNLKIPKPFTAATFVQNSFGELAPKNASAFEKLDHDFFTGSLRGLLTLSAKGMVFKKKSPVSAIVRDFQQALKNLGFYKDILDGDFGKNTEAALLEFQKSSGMAETGQIDENLWKILLK